MNPDGGREFEPWRVLMKCFNCFLFFFIPFSVAIVVISFVYFLYGKLFSSKTYSFIGIEGGEFES